MCNLTLLVCLLGGVAGSEAPASAPAVITSGVACPRGALQRDDSLVAMANGRVLPTECQPLAFWPEGSVKWMRVTARVGPAVERIELKPAGRQPATAPAASQPAGPSVQAQMRLLRMNPAYVAQTGVLGPYREANPRDFPQLEQIASDLTRQLLARQADPRRFARWDRGDPDEAVAASWLLWQYLRTGQAECFDAGAALVKSMPKVPTAAAEVFACRLHYYLSANPGSRDRIEEAYRSAVVRNRAGPSCDGMAAAMYALYAHYEMTGNPEYRRRIDAFIDEYAAYAVEHGYFPARTPWDFAADKPAGEFSGRCDESPFWQSFGMANFLIEWYWLTGHGKLREGLIRQAETIRRQEAPGGTCVPLQVLAAGYRLTSDNAYRRHLGELLRLQMENRPLGTDMPWFEPWDAREAAVTPRMLSGLLSALPYVTGAVADEPSLVVSRANSR